MHFNEIIVNNIYAQNGSFFLDLINWNINIDTITFSSSNKRKLYYEYILLITQATFLKAQKCSIKINKLMLYNIF